MSKTDDMVFSFGKKAIFCGRIQDHNTGADSTRKDNRFTFAMTDVLNNGPNYYHINTSTEQKRIIYQKVNKLLAGR